MNLESPKNQLAQPARSVGYTLGTARRSLTPDVTVLRDLLAAGGCPPCLGMPLSATRYPNRHSADGPGNGAVHAASRPRGICVPERRLAASLYPFPVLARFRRCDRGI